MAFLTAISFAELAKIYPDAGFGSCYCFAEKAFLDREEKTHHKWAPFSQNRYWAWAVRHANSG